MNELHSPRSFSVRSSPVARFAPAATLASSVRDTRHSSSSKLGASVLTYIRASLNFPLKETRGRFIVPLPITDKYYVYLLES